MTDINQHHVTLLNKTNSNNNNAVIEEEEEGERTLQLEQDISVTAPNSIVQDISSIGKFTLPEAHQETLNVNDIADSELEEELMEENIHDAISLVTSNLDHTSLVDSDSQASQITPSATTVGIAAESIQQEEEYGDDNNDDINDDTRENQQEATSTEEERHQLIASNSSSGSASSDSSSNSNRSRRSSSDLYVTSESVVREFIHPMVTSNNSTPTPSSYSPPANINTTRHRSQSSASPSTLNNGGGLLPRYQRVWEMDRQAPECRRCHRRFNFLVRRHHCRRCGQIVCDKCSSNRIRLPVEELIEDPIVSPAQYPSLATQSQRVCDTCYREPIRRLSESHRNNNRSSSSSRPMVFMRRTESTQSLMIDCPVCGHTFLSLQKPQQEQHLQRCLNIGSPPVQSPRYIVYQLSSNSTQVGDECPICLEEFDEGDKISRMICLCSYHQHCLASWLEKGKGCPVHYDTFHQPDSNE